MTRSLARFILEGVLGTLLTLSRPCCVFKSAQYTSRASLAVVVSCESHDAGAVSQCGTGFGGVCVGGTYFTIVVVVVVSVVVFVCVWYTSSASKLVAVIT